MRNRVYLAGPIYRCSDAECRDWRNLAKDLLGEGWEAIDPMRRDFRGMETTHAGPIVNCDHLDIDSCHVMLANAQKPTWGTAMEIHYAFQTRKILIVAWIGLDEHPSPWLRMHCHYIAPGLKEAVDFIKLP